MASRLPEGLSWCPSFRSGDWTGNMPVFERISAPGSASTALLAVDGVTDAPVGCRMASDDGVWPLESAELLSESAAVGFTEASGVWSFGIVRNESEMYHGAGQK